MDTHRAEWRSGLDEVDAALLDEHQGGFPVREAPFDVLAEELGTDPSDVLDRLRTHADAGIVRRVGPVLDPSVIGSSVLAGLSVPEEQFYEVAKIVNEYPQVSHNYRRDHEWNMWFVLAARSRERRDELLEEIADRSDLEPLVLPKRREYCLDLQFPIVSDSRSRKPAAVSDSSGPTSDAEERIDTNPDRRRSEPETSRELSMLDRTVLEAIQEGFPLTETPYRDLADDLEVDVASLLSSIEGLLADGYIKRLGVIVSHRSAGFRSNCMVVWNVPDEELDRIGEYAGSRPYVTKCYYRPRRPERGWEYNLFTMIHGRDPDRVDEWIEELAESIDAPYQRLNTTEKLKQTGTRYGALLADRPEADRADES